MHSRKLIPRGQSLLVAVSGGVDSMVLLHLLHALAGRHGWRLTVAHFNHQLRGRSSDADERLVRRTAASLGLKVVVERGDVRAHARQRGLSLEMAARALRHDFFARTARRLRIGTVVLAHHADDQVELFFLRVLRGAGGEGLAGMKWIAPSPLSSAVRLVRPLLDVSKADLKGCALRRKIRFRDDASNTVLDIKRNRIRHQLLPLLKTVYQPALLRTVLRVMELTGAEAELVSETAQGWLVRKHRPGFGRLPVAVQRRCLQLQLHKLGVPADFETVELLRGCPERPVSLSPLVSVWRDAAGRVDLRTHLPVAFNENEVAVALGNGPGEVVFDNVQFRWRVVTANGLPRTASRQCEFFDADEVGSDIVLRHWRRGDRFQPIGLGASVKLQDWFTNRKVPRAWRHRLVVAATADGRIYWVEGQRIAEPFRLTPQTRRSLIWRWERH